MRFEWFEVAGGLVLGSGLLWDEVRVEGAEGMVNQHHALWL